MRFDERGEFSQTVEFELFGSRHENLIQPPVCFVEKLGTGRLTKPAGVQRYTTKASENTSLKELQVWALLLSCVMPCCDGSADPTTPLPDAAVLTVSNENLQTGSLIFSRGDCLAVKVFSQSSYTHVGGVVFQNGEPIVYDSMNGVGVRKTPLAEYLRQQTPSTVHFVHPKTAFTADQSAAFETHLESQLGRKYAVRHHLTGKRCDGLHCAEYLTDALMAANLMHANNPSRVSPASLREGVIGENAYVDGQRVELKEAEVETPQGLTWYYRAWDCTTKCCSNGTTQLRRWILCR